MSDLFPPKRPDGLLCVSYGGGINSVAVLVLLRERGLVPRAIVMANPGSERRGTMRYLAEVTNPTLAAWGFPQVEVIDRITEGQHIKRAWRLETLEDECLRTKSLPSVAYGWKKCSAKYKGDTQRWWAARQPWMQAEWVAGRKVVKVIGYDADEQRRVRSVFALPREASRFVPWYPLVEAGWNRDDCEEKIAAAGLPLPTKSACTFCPNNTLAEWEELRREEPEAFERAVAMSRNAEASIESPEVVGLMRCNPHGKRQLHVWADDGYGGELGGKEDDMPCECAL